MERPSELANLLEGKRVFVHLDLDVLDPSVLPAQFPAPGGLSDGGLRTLLDEIGARADLVGCEITALAAPDRAEHVATIVDRLIPEDAR